MVYYDRPFHDTHKIAISNHRITSLANGWVCFTATDYRKGGARVSHGLSDSEFVRRFSLHVLPKGFVRIRHYGILSSSRKKIVRPLLMVEMGQPQPKPGVRPILHRKCPKGKEGALVTVFMFDSRGHRSRWKRAAREIGGLISNEGPKVNFFKISIGIRLGVSPTHKVNDSLSW